MAKFYFRHAVMNSGKSLALLQVNHNYISVGKKTILFSHVFDNRFGNNVIASRLGVQAESIPVDEDLNIYKHVEDIVNSGEIISCILCDEVQFYTEKQIEELSDVVDFLKIPVICYGLKLSAFGKLFDASKRLIELADEIEEIRHVCWCGKRANMILRHDDSGNVIKSGNLVDVGAESKYKSVCRKHWKQGLYENNENSII